jgi:hypothetical protein
VIECVPAERLEVEKVATPLALSAGAPRGVLPSKNVTVPVGVPVPEVGATVAVKVTVCPRGEGFGVEVSEVAVPIKLTFCVRVEELLPL